TQQRCYQEERPKHLTKDGRRHACRRQCEGLQQQPSTHNAYNKGKSKGAPRMRLNAGPPLMDCNM
ncbi:Hypothetical predicted protein, partial [Pelobates cultripes]